MDDSLVSWPPYRIAFRSSRSQSVLTGPRRPTDKGPTLPHQCVRCAPDGDKSHSFGRALLPRGAGATPPAERPGRTPQPDPANRMNGPNQRSSPATTNAPPPLPLGNDVKVMVLIRTERQAQVIGYVAGCRPTQDRHRGDHDRWIAHVDLCCARECLSRGIIRCRSTFGEVLVARPTCAARGPRETASTRGSPEPLHLRHLVAADVARAGRDGQRGDLCLRGGWAHNASAMPHPSPGWTTWRHESRTCGSRWLC